MGLRGLERKEQASRISGCVANVAEALRRA